VGGTRCTDGLARLFSIDRGVESGRGSIGNEGSAAAAAAATDVVSVVVVRIRYKLDAPSSVRHDDNDDDDNDDDEKDPVPENPASLP